MIPQTAVHPRQGRTKPLFVSVIKSREASQCSRSRHRRAQWPPAAPRDLLLAPWRAEAQCDPWPPAAFSCQSHHTFQRPSPLLLPPCNAIHHWHSDSCLKVSSAQSAGLFFFFWFATHSFSHLLSVISCRLVLWRRKPLDKRGGYIRLRIVVGISVNEARYVILYVYLLFIQSSANVQPECLEWNDSGSAVNC